METITGETPIEERIVIGEKSTHNEGGDSEFTYQSLSLQDMGGVEVVHAYAKGGDDCHYGIFWNTDLNIKERFGLIEKCLTFYEAEHSEDVINSLTGEDRSDISEVEIVKKKSNKEHELIYQEFFNRPLTWEQILDMVGDESESITSVTIDTPFARFGIDFDGHYNFSVLSHVAEKKGLENLLLESAGGNISEEETLAFLTKLDSLSQ